MLELSKPKKVKLVAAFIYASPQTYKKATSSLIKRFGPIDLESKALDFDFTEYYNTEMGSGLKRGFISFKKLIDPGQIVEVKLFTVKLEKRLAIVRKRRINIDPGYVNEAKLVLSTTKDFSHRVYLGKRIFAEVTLIYKNKGFRSLPWTFPDYRTTTYKNIFTQIRNLYKEGLKSLDK
ncbi:DUF4416 family protein [Candidatus Omnitrophota bacterium]